MSGSSSSVVSVVSLCAFPAGAVLWEAQPGQLSLTVIVKATFALRPDEAVVAPEQDPLGEERHWDDNVLSSVYEPGDFAPSKRRVDVTLVGHAYAAPGDPVTSLVARLTVGGLVKAVRITGDRGWTMGSEGRFEPGPPAPFLRMPLRYERAVLSADNPIGIDVLAPPVVAMPARPNLEPAPGSEVTPCFGPVAPTWRARRRLLDEAATFWAYGIARDPRADAPPLGPVPPRFEFAFFNVAPKDQQVDLFRPGTPIVLEHLHPQHPHLATRLPPIRPQVFRVPPADTPRARVEEIALRADSLWIDTDRGVATVTWRGLTDVGRGAAGVGHLVVAADPEGKKLRWERVEKRLGEGSAPTLRLDANGLPPEEPDETPPPDPLGRRHDTVKGQRLPEGGGAVVISAADGSDAGVEDAPTNPLERRRDEDRTQALPELSRPSPGRRPAAGMPAGTLATMPARPVTPVTLRDAHAMGALPPSPTRADAPPDQITLVSMEAQKITATLVSPGDSLKLTPPRVSPVEIVQPPSIQPLAGPRFPVAGPSPPLIKAPGARPVVMPPAPLAGSKAPRPTLKMAPAPRAPTPTLRKDLTVQRYAEIAAALAQKGADRAAVLRSHLLTGPAWSLIDDHWKKAIAAEAEHGGGALTEAHDDAYVGTQERLCQSIDVAAYARLQVGLERGEVGKALADLDLSLGDLMRLQRVWARRVAASPDLGAQLLAAVEVARRAPT